MQISPVSDTIHPKNNEHAENLITCIGLSQTLHLTESGSGLVAALPIIALTSVFPACQPFSRLYLTSNLLSFHPPLDALPAAELASF
jgi:hypothetical protein